MKTSTTIALALSTLLAGPLAAYAQTEQPTAAYHHYHVHRSQGPHRTVHHRFVAQNPVPAPAPAAVSTTAAHQAARFVLSGPNFAPYPYNMGD